MLNYFSILVMALVLSASSFNARVIKVTDGDTIVVVTNSNKQVKIRLEGIDCPERNQDFGQKAKQTTSDLCFGKTVKIVKTGKDGFGRTLAYVYVGNECINKTLLKRGMAWHFKKYNNNNELAKLEVNARKAKVGLWSKQKPTAPWDWRKRKKI